MLLRLNETQRLLHLYWSRGRSLYVLENASTIQRGEQILAQGGRIYQMRDTNTT